jgi:hypothetical protein
MLAASRAASAQEQLVAMSTSAQYGSQTTPDVGAALSQPAPVSNIIGPLGQKMSFQWTGGLVPAVRALAAAAGFTVQEIGKPSATPVIVTLNDQQTSIYNLLQECGIQAGSVAGVAIYPNQNLVEIVWGRQSG